jgi:hypothetical protein
MRWISVARWGTFAALVILQAPIQAQSSASQLPVSLDRIRLALQEPPPVLQVPVQSGQKPSFRVEVRQPVLRPIEHEPPLDPTFGLPSVGELLMDGVMKIHWDLVNYKRSRAERRARKEVEDALAALCAVRECPAPRSPN